MKAPHIPVLLSEILQQFEGKKLRTFLDGTLGAAGHAAAILQAHPEIEKYIGCDRDQNALHIAEKTLEPWQKKVELVHSNFSEIQQILKDKKVPCVDGILLDLGVSSMQLDQGERGFSFSKEADLDMRMDQTQSLTAAEIVNQFPEKDLQQIFRDLGEEPYWKKIASAIVRARTEKTIQTTKELAEIIQRVSRGKKGLHPATLVFQALRIYVNKELESLEKGIENAIEALSPDGRLAVISFHSLEDRIVKNTFKAFSGRKMYIDQVHSQKTATLKVLTKKPITPSNAEIKKNPRSRSAKLRVAEKLGGA